MARSIFDASKLRVGGTYSIDFTNQRTRKTTTFDGKYVEMSQGSVFLQGDFGRKIYLPCEGVSIVSDDHGNRIWP